MFLPALTPIPSTAVSTARTIGRARLLIAALALPPTLMAFPAAAAPQAAPPPSGQPISTWITPDVLAGDAGVVATGLLLRQLDGEKRVLMIGAHPDDEDTALLAALARGAGARTAYLSLTRGEGGQNVIGPELNEGLGIIRTGELLAARGLDGAEQYFTRAYDFGYSRTAEESFGQWPQEELLDDVVRIVRRFRPQVIVSIFQGTSADGHGQHQVAGILARRAFTSAGDPQRFPHHMAEGLAPWTPSKLYVSTRRRPDQATTRVDAGSFDPLLGRSAFQIAMEGRSLHRSQEMGAPQHPGPRSAPLLLVDSRMPSADGEEGIFTGIDTTLPGAASFAGYRAAVHEAAEALDVRDPSRAAAPLSRALAHLRDRAATDDQVLTQRQALTARAVLASAGVVMEARSDRDRAVPGEVFQVEVRVWNGGPVPLEDVEPTLALPPGWHATPLPAGAVDETSAGFFFGRIDGTPLAGPAHVAPGELGRWRFDVTVGDGAEPSREYYLLEERDGALYRWPADPSLKGLARTPPVVRPEIALRLTPPGGEMAEINAGVPLEHVSVDRILGEVWKPFLVVPRLSVAVEPEWLVWPQARTQARPITVRVRSELRGETTGRARLELPAGWRAEPESLPFTLAGQGREAELTFELRPDGAPGRLADPGRVRIRAVVTADDGETFHEGFELIDYPHIDRTPLYRPAAVDITVVGVQVTDGLRVGYIMGSGDDGAEALRQMGAQVELLGPEAVRTGDLNRFHTLILGVRAYEVRPEVAAANDRILRFARQGGTVLVQYHKYEYPDGEFAPYPVQMARPHDRVTDPGASVRILDPDSPLLNVPNSISEEDFDGWVQERGLYFLNAWDERFTPLLEMSDPGLDPVQGALVTAPVGEGLYIYTGLAFFRQIPAGVPGAFRLLANLASARANAR